MAVLSKKQLENIQKYKEVAGTVGILITVTGYVWKPGILNIAPKLGAIDYRRFMRFIAFEMQKELQKAIEIQRYREVWLKEVQKFVAKNPSKKRNYKKGETLSISYLNYKKTHGLSDKTWEATKHLKTHIKVFRRYDYIAVGFKENEYYPFSNVKINKVARWVEYGGIRMPSRPLFRKVQEYMRKNLDQYYRKFVREILNPIPTPTNVKKNK
jgi:hypothetical protein